MDDLKDRGDTNDSKIEKEVKAETNEALNKKEGKSVTTMPHSELMQYLTSLMDEDKKMLDKLQVLQAEMVTDMTDVLNNMDLQDFEKEVKTIVLDAKKTVDKMIEGSKIKEGKESETLAAEVSEEDFTF